MGNVDVTQQPGLLFFFPVGFADSVEVKIIQAYSRIIIQASVVAAQLLNCVTMLPDWYV